MSCERWLFFANVAQIYLCRYVVVFCSLPFYESLLQTDLDDLYYVGIKKKKKRVFTDIEQVVCLSFLVLLYLLLLQKPWQSEFQHQGSTRLISVK